MSRRSPKPLLLTWFLLAVALTCPHPAAAWGDEGHRVIALIAEHYLDPIVRAKAATLLATDADTLTDHDIADEATWADKYRDSDRDTTKIRYEATWRWHFVDIELAQSDLASACFDHPPLPPGVPASQGPPQACVVDKIDHFAAELGNPATGASEQLLALKFLLHFVGDLHQPLHASDDRDAGGNKKVVGGEGTAQIGDIQSDAYLMQVQALQVMSQFRDDQTLAFLVDTLDNHYQKITRLEKWAADNHLDKSIGEPVIRLIFYPASVTEQRDGYESGRVPTYGRVSIVFANLLAGACELVAKGGTMPVSHRIKLDYRVPSPVRQ